MCLDVFACLVWALGILWNFMKALSVVKRAMVETNSTDLAEEQLSEVYHRFVSEIKTSREGRIAFWKQCCFIQYMNPPNREPHPCVHISNYLKVVNSKSFLWGYFALASFFSKKLTPRSTKPSGHDALWVFSHGCWAKKFKYRVKRDLGFSMWKHTFLTTPTAINKHDLVHIVLLTILGGHSNSFNWMTCLGQPTMLGLWVSASRNSRKQTATERPTKLDTSFQLKIIIYCGWKKSCTSWYMVYPIICRVSSIQGGAGFLPSTCHIWGFTPQPRQFSNHQQQGSK